MDLGPSSNQVLSGSHQFPGCLMGQNGLPLKAEADRSLWVTQWAESQLAVLGSAWWNAAGPCDLGK